jgi:putative DNA modification/repair radical SAM protein
VNLYGILAKLDILAGAAKYDVSCSSSGVSRKNQGGTGNTKSFGICHAWSADGRCISLLKILLSNDCIYDCRYCINRRSNDIPLASFAPRELADLPMHFSAVPILKVLFLSAAPRITGLHHGKDTPVLTLLLKNRVSGFNSCKVNSRCRPSLIYQAGLVGRMSDNIEQPTEQSLRLLAPPKSLPVMYSSMRPLRDQSGFIRGQPAFSAYTSLCFPPAVNPDDCWRQSGDSDLTILHMTQALYQTFGLKRVYYSAYVPVNRDANLPALATAPPLLREHRLYQSDWLLRFYHFKAEEIVDPAHANLETEIDPKTAWALRHPEFFPLEVNRASYEELLRVPGIGPKSAGRILSQRRVAAVSADQLKKLGVVYKRAQYFVTCKGIYSGNKPFDPAVIRRIMVPETPLRQLSLF